MDEIPYTKYRIDLGVDDGEMGSQERTDISKSGVSERCVRDPRRG